MSLRIRGISLLVFLAALGGFLLLPPVAEAKNTFTKKSRYVLPQRIGEREFVGDWASLINESDETRIKQICDKLLTDKAIPIIVLTVNSLTEYGGDPSNIEDFAAALFNKWGIGHDKVKGTSGQEYDWNLGILFLVSKNDRKARIELGGDWGRRKDSHCDQIMNDLIISQFKQNKYSKGILYGVEGLDAMAREIKLPTVPRPWWHYALIVGFVVLMIGTGVSLYQEGASGWAWIMWGIIFSILGAILWAILTSKSRGGGSANFGGGSFGGGSSGGGGSTGSW